MAKKIELTPVDMPKPVFSDDDWNIYDNGDETFVILSKNGAVCLIGNKIFACDICPAFCGGAKKHFGKNTALAVIEP